MKKFLLAMLLLCTTKVLIAQAPAYDDLRILYADENYVQLINLSTKYSEKEKTKNDALVHFWLGRGLHSISKTKTKVELYKNAYKESISEIGKSIKLDKSGDLNRTYGEFIEAFKMELIDTIFKNTSIADYKNASYWVFKYYKLETNSLGAEYLEAACKFRTADKKAAEPSWKDAEKRMAALTEIDNYNKADKKLLKMGILQTADCFMANAQAERARLLLKKAKNWFEDENDFMVKYKQIVK